MPPARRLLRVARFLRPVAVAAVVAGVILPASAAHADPSIPHIEQQIKSRSSDLEKIIESYNRANEEFKQSQHEAAVVSAKIGPLQAQMVAATEQVSSIAVRAYKGGDMLALSSLLSSGSAEVAVSRMTTIDQIVRSRQHDLDVFSATKKSRDTEVATLAKLVAQQRAHRDELADKRVKIKKELAALYAMRRQAYATANANANANAGGGGGGSSGHPPAPYVAGRAGAAVRYAYGALGKPYVWASEGPNGYDCSGLTKAAWRAAGISLPHNAAMQYNAVSHLSRSQLRPGDLVFYSGLGHVAIYVGNGRIIHAPTPGQSVQLASVDMMSPYGYGRPG